jgi:hypothetical protein
MLFTVGRPGKTQTKNPAFLILYGQTLFRRFIDVLARIEIEAS